MVCTSQTVYVSAASREPRDRATGLSPSASTDRDGCTHAGRVCERTHPQLCAVIRSRSF
eukprot:SAG31_NODE_32079_length_360_cov_0.950192_1_plen_58_part_10